MALIPKAFKYPRVLGVFSTWQKKREPKKKKKKKKSPVAVSIIQPISFKKEGTEDGKLTYNRETVA